MKESLLKLDTLLDLFETFEKLEEFEDIKCVKLSSKTMKSVSAGEYKGYNLLIRGIFIEEDNTLKNNEIKIEFEDDMDKINNKIEWILRYIKQRKVYDSGEYEFIRNLILNIKLLKDMINEH